AEAERKYQEMLRTWSTGSGAKPKIVLFENAISDLGWQVVETSARMSLRNKVVKPALAFISGGLITLASIAVVEAIAQNFFGYD
ncbi:MAG: hypothetical protein ACE5GN_05785, partial [Waddliaceae bacterium]